VRCLIYEGKTIKRITCNARHNKRRLLNAVKRGVERQPEVFVEQMHFLGRAGSGFSANGKKTRYDKSHKTRQNGGKGDARYLYAQRML
jgi:hypothetical protein